MANAKPKIDLTTWIGIGAVIIALIAFWYFTVAHKSQHPDQVAQSQNDAQLQSVPSALAQKATVTAPSRAITALAEPVSPAPSATTPAATQSNDPTQTQTNDPAQLLQTPPATTPTPAAATAQRPAVVDMSSALTSAQARIKTLSSDNSSLTGIVATLQNKVNTLSEKLTATEKAEAAAEKRVQEVEAENMHLVHEVHSKSQDLASRSGLPGWRVQGANGTTAVLVGPDGTTEVVHVGQVVYGERIVSIDPKNLRVRTNVGVISDR